MFNILTDEGVVEYFMNEPRGQQININTLRGSQRREIPRHSNVYGLHHRLN